MISQRPIVDREPAHVGILMMVADEERRLISKRTKEALAAAKARSVKLGGNRGSIISAEAHEISPTLVEPPQRPV